MAYDSKLEKLVLNRDFYRYKYQTSNIFNKDENYRKWRSAYDELTRYLKKHYPERYLQRDLKTAKAAEKKPEVRMSDWSERFEEYGD